MNSASSSLSRLIAMRPDRMTVALVGELLAGSPVQIVLADDAQELLRLCREDAPDLVLLNSALRDSSGLDALRTLRADPELHDLPVLMITAKSGTESRRAAMDAGADDFVSKPFDLDDLELRLRAILRANRYRKLLTGKRRFELLAEQAPQGILLVDERHRLQFANSAATQLGLDVGSRLSWQEQISVGFLRRPDDQWAALDRGELPERLLLLERPRDVPQATRWYSCQLRPLPGDPERQYMVSISEITGVVQRQSTLWSVKSLILHKLRTPVNGLLAPAEMLLEEPLNPGAMELAQIISESASRLADTVAGIDRFFESRHAKAGSPCLVEDLKALLPVLAAEQKIRTPSLSLLDPSLSRLPLTLDTLSDVLRELFGNARKFHPANDPHVQIVISNGNGNELRIDVVDNGRRVSPDQLRKLHVPFYQAEDQFTGEVSGQGLGLSQVARMVWEAGGRLNFSNRGDTPGLCVSMAFGRRRPAQPVARKRVETSAWDI